MFLHSFFVRLQIKSLVQNNFVCFVLFSNPWDPFKLKGYSGVSLIHGLTHLDTEYDPPSRDKVCGPLAYIVLASSETTAGSQHIFQGIKHLISLPALSEKINKEYPFNSRPAGGDPDPHNVLVCIKLNTYSKSRSLSSLFSNTFSFTDILGVYCQSCGTRSNVFHIDGHPLILITYSFIFFNYYLDICDHVQLLMSYYDSQW